MFSETISTTGQSSGSGDRVKVSRKSSWNRAINAVQVLEPNIRWPLLSLKRLDAELWKRTPRLIRIREKKSITEAEHALLQETIGDAFFWVLGAYEMIRTLDRRCKTMHSGSAIALHFSEAKRQLERVRVPLAKLEPARRHKDSDHSFALAVLARGKGYCWRVADGNDIAFTWLSDQALHTLASYHKSGGAP